MTLGAERSQTTVFQGDTSELYAYFYGVDETVVPQAGISAVTFTIRDPAGVDHIASGAVNPDGSCFYRFTTTTLTGVYKWTAQATLTTGEKRTYKDTFAVEDPLADPPTTHATEITDQVWLRLEDCFDSEEGGPWLRDMTLSYFEPDKIGNFIAEGLMRINVSPPTTNLDLGYFTATSIDPDPNLPANTPLADPDRFLIVQATLLSVIRHLMRSYTEQPTPTGANVVWQDRRDYLQRWGTIYQLEEAMFKEMVALWKRQFYNFGQGRLLTGSKAGRLYPSGYRARNASRGYT